MQEAEDLYQNSSIFSDDSIRMQPQFCFRSISYALPEDTSTCMAPQQTLASVIDSLTAVLPAPRRKPTDYTKNIFGYITKKVIQHFACEPYRPIVQQMCDSQGVDYVATTAVYHRLKQMITGPGHLHVLLEPSTKCGLVQDMVTVFLEFYVWFLRERYVRVLMVEGKMRHKERYARYKNERLLPMLEARLGQRRGRAQGRGEQFQNYLTFN